MLIYKKFCLFGRSSCIVFKCVMISFLLMSIQVVFNLCYYKLCHNECVHMSLHACSQEWNGWPKEICICNVDTDIVLSITVEPISTFTSSVGNCLFPQTDKACSQSSIALPRRQVKNDILLWFLSMGEVENIYKCFKAFCVCLLCCKMFISFTVSFY